MSRTTEMRELLYRNNDEIEKRIERGIEENRIGKFDLTVTDENGTPISGQVKIEQLDHDFNIGANLLMFDQLETPYENEKYKEYFAKCFNTATISFFWNSLEPEQGKHRFSADSPFIYRRPPIDPCLEFCESNGITPKAQCLNYDAHTPDWLIGANVFEVKKALLKRFETLAERYADRIPCWEVFNELLSNNGKTPFYDADDVMKWSYAQAERLFPGNELMTNEATSIIFTQKGDQHTVPSARNPYYMLCKEAILEGCRVDLIGMQFHYFVPEELAVEQGKCRLDMKYHFAVLDQMAKLGKPLQITEVTLPAYSGKEEDQQFQAEMVRMFYRAWFSHPAMKGAIYWNLPDGYAYRAEPGDMTAGENIYWGGLLNFDMTPKPAYNALYDLFHKEYCTNTSADATAGNMSFNGYFGKYRISVGDKSGIVTFKRGGRGTQKVVLK